MSAEKDGPLLDLALYRDVVLHKGPIMAIAKPKYLRYRPETRCEPRNASVQH